MNLEPIALYLEQQTQPPLGIRGQSLFINALPADTEPAILLRDPFGGAEILHELPGYRRASFQVIVRAKDYREGQTLSKAVSSALTMENASLTGMDIKFMRPRHDPFTFAPSPGNSLEWVVNIDAAYVLV